MMLGNSNTKFTIRELKRTWVGHVVCMNNTEKRWQIFKFWATYSLTYSPRQAK